MVRLSTRVSVGMSEADAIKLLGEPTYIFNPGEQVIPEHVAGFIPDRPVERHLLVYQRMFDLFIFVFTDDKDRVVAVYSCRS